MFYLVEFSSGVTSSYMIAVGIILVVLHRIPQGIVGTVRHAWSGRGRDPASDRALSRNFGGVQAVKDVDLSLPRARSARSSARTAPARPPLPA